MSVIRKGTPKWRVHPGEILREEFLKPMGISAYELAQRLRVPAPRVNDIVLERRGISADTAVRLARFFGTTEQFWLNLQGAYEISRVHGGTCNRDPTDPTKIGLRITLRASLTRSAAVPAAVRRASSPAAPRARRPRDCRQDAGATKPDHLCPFFPRGQRAITTVEIPPRGRNSPFTSAHTGFAQRTTSSST
jgi:antitoxin HigA-1